MPLLSKAQARLMYSTLGGADTGVSKSVAKEFVEKTPKNRFKYLKEYVSKNKTKQKNPYG